MRLNAFQFMAAAGAATAVAVSAALVTSTAVSAATATDTVAVFQPVLSAHAPEGVFTIQKRDGLVTVPKPMPTGPAVPVIPNPQPMPLPVPVPDLDQRAEPDSGPVVILPADPTAAATVNTGYSATNNQKEALKAALMGQASQLMAECSKHPNGCTPAEAARMKQIAESAADPVVINGIWDFFRLFKFSYGMDFGPKSVAGPGRSSASGDSGDVAPAAIPAATARTVE
ncbi:hypothetical protein KEM52_002001 [Ascosphaera acerosa]|nr:hypothetical protein KEM52_002001 [Ascosphaera acerosa]